MLQPTDRICFLCGSLEPGRDGVGDYTRRLAAAFVRRGLEAIIVALNDRWMHHGDEGPVVQTEDGTDVTAYRIANLKALLARKNGLRNILERHGITVISLQYVPYSFSRRGLPFKLASYLKQASSDSRWHLMCHELWLQDSWRSPKNKIIGLMQRRVLNNLLRMLQPVAIHTSISYYQRKLGELGWASIVRPVYGNFALAPDSGWSLRAELTCRKVPPETNIVVFFGTIYPHFPVESFVSFLTRHVSRTGVRLVLCLLGRNSFPPSREKLSQALTENAADIGIFDFGQLNPPRIRRAFIEASFGVCTTPLEHGGKSGSAAAMLESGLCVVGYTSKVARSSGQAPAPGMIDLADGDPDPMQLARLSQIPDSLSCTLESIITSL